MRWLLSGNKARLVGALALSVIAYLFAGALMFTSGYMISLAATIPLSVLALHLPSIFVRIFGIGKPPIQYAYRLSSHDWVLRMTSRLRLCLYDALRRKTSVTQSQEKTGHILSMLTDDIGHAQDLVLRGVLPIAAAWIVAIILVVASGALSFVLGICLLLLLLISCLIVPLATATFNAKEQHAIKVKNDQLYEAITDSANGLVDWVLSGRREEFANMQARLFEEKAKLGKKVRLRRRACTLISQMLFCACILSIVIWAAFTFAPAMQDSVFTQTYLPISDFSKWIGNVSTINSQPYPANWIAAFALCFFPVLEAFSLIEPSIETLKQQKTSVDDLVDYIGESAKVKPQDFKDEKDDDKTSNNMADLQMSDKPDVHIDSIDFSYGDNRIFSDFDLLIPYGEKIAIVGRSGIGKTTLVSLIHGDLYPQMGAIELGGVQTNKLEGSMHDIVCIIGQFPYLFDMSLKENLLIAKPNATNEEIMQALALVGLKETVDKLPDGINTRMTEQGKRFSGGERHRIALARIFLADQPIIILDEPFANLDQQTESEILDVLFNVFSDKTLIVITHHTKYLDRFERIVEL